MKELIYSTKRNIKKDLKLQFPELTNIEYLKLKLYCDYYNHKLVYNTDRKKAFILEYHSNNGNPYVLKAYIQKDKNIFLVYTDNSSKVLKQKEINNIINEIGNNSQNNINIKFSIEPIKQLEECQK